MRNKLKLMTALALSALSLVANAANNSDMLDKSLNSEAIGTKVSQEAIDNVEKLVEKTDNEKSLIQTDRREVRLLSHYRDHLAITLENLKTQRENVAKKREDLREVRVALYPLMQDLLQTLSEILKRDIPFDSAERQMRVDSLLAIMKDASVTPESQMDRLLDAFQVEVSYGFTLAAVTTKDSEGDLKRFIRVGRLGYWKTAVDGTNPEVWVDGKWVAVTEDAVDKLDTLYKVATGEISPDVVVLPNEGIRK